MFLRLCTRMCYGTFDFPHVLENMCASSRQSRSTNICDVLKFLNMLFSAAQGSGHYGALDFPRMHYTGHLISHVCTIRGHSISHVCTIRGTQLPMNVLYGTLDFPRMYYTGHSISHVCTGPCSMLLTGHVVTHIYYVALHD